MYRYIMCFQIICILISGICLYLAITDDGLRTKKHGLPILVTLSGIFLAETSYGLYLQEIAMAGLQVAEKICLMGKLLAAVGFFMTCVSLSERDSHMVKMAAGILGLTAAVFLFSDHLYKFLYFHQNFLQNQYFYYIETEWTMFGEIFYLFMRCLPLFGVLWFVFGKRKRALPENVLLMAALALWAVSAICKKMVFLRHYDADMPVCAAFAVCLIIFMIWGACNAKKQVLH